MARKIVVASPSTRTAKEIETDAKTFGELKQNSQFSALYSNKLDAIESETSATLSRNDAILPEGDFTIYLVPTENKSGVDTKSLIDLIKATVEKSNENLRGELHDKIDEIFDEESDDSDEDDEYEDDGEEDEEDSYSVGYWGRIKSALTPNSAPKLTPAEQAALDAANKKFGF